MPSNRDLKDFSGNKSTIKSKIILTVWFPIQHLVFKSAFLPSAVRPILLKLFGASIGRSVFIRRGVKVHFPWNLEIGDNCWIGE